MSSSPPTNERKDALLAQFTELNNRSRWYSNQLWQVPFAYLGIVGLAVSVAEKAEPKLLAWLFVLLGLVGVMTFLHLLGIAEGEGRAVDHLIDLESTLGLPQTIKKRKYHEPLFVIVLLVIAACFIGAIYGFTKTP